MAMAMTKPVVQMPILGIKPTTLSLQVVEEYACNLYGVYKTRDLDWFDGCVEVSEHAWPMARFVSSLL